MMSDLMTQPKRGGMSFSPVPEVFDGNGNAIPPSQITTTEYYFCATCGRGWSGQPKVGVDEKPAEHLPALVEGEHAHDYDGSGAESEHLPAPVENEHAHDHESEHPHE
jgi:hypothetical protein